MIKTYRKKPIVVQAIRYWGNNIKEIEDFTGQIMLRYTTENKESEHLIGLPISNGIKAISVGDYIIRDDKNEFRTCDSDLFKQMYEEVIL